MERRVGPERQQLACIDGILITPGADFELFNLKAIAGEVHWVITMTNFASLPDYKENEQRRNSTISLIPAVDVGGAFGFSPTYKEEKYRAPFNDVRFHRAMSLAVGRDGSRTFLDGSNLTIQVAACTGGPVDIRKLFELEIAQWAEVDLRVMSRLVDDAAWGENVDADEFMLQPGGIDAITEFWNWINGGSGSGGVGLHDDFNMTGSYD